MSDLVPLSGPAAADGGLDAELDALARRYLGAGGSLIRLVMLAGGSVENALERLPDAAKNRLEQAARAALSGAYEAARATRHVGPRGEGAHRAAVAALGAAGGFGGLASALAELPVTATTLMRSIQEIAERHGENPALAETRAECLRVLGTGGPLREDDGTDLGFLGARLTLTGPALHRLVAQVAPRFAAAMGQKLAAQTVPVIGAVAGAGVNLAFARYYQEMAHVHFGLRRLARDGEEDANAAFQARVACLRALRG